jgi:CheY-like chemotaxis protein
MNAVGAGRRILVVEDDKASGESLRDLFVQMGFDVQVVTDGETAVQVTPAYGPAFIFMDIGLPGIDGYEATRQIRRDDSGNSAVIVALSGYSQRKFEDQAAAAGMDHFLLKPASLNELNQVFAQSGG